MKESIGGLSLMSIFIFFFIMVTFFLTGTILYYKGFKVNSRIVSALEKYEGYNSSSAEEIDRILSTIGYRSSSVMHASCGTARDGSAIECLKDNGNYELELSCERNYKNTNGNYSGGNYYIIYKVKTYIYFDLPMNLSFKIPVTAKSNPIYQFRGYENGLGC